MKVVEEQPEVPVIVSPAPVKQNVKQLLESNETCQKFLRAREAHANSCKELDSVLSKHNHLCNLEKEKEGSQLSNIAIVEKQVDILALALAKEEKDL